MHRMEEDDEMKDEEEETEFDNSVDEDEVEDPQGAVVIDVAVDSPVRKQTTKGLKRVVEDRLFRRKPE